MSYKVILDSCGELTFENVSLTIQIDNIQMTDDENLVQ